MQRYTIEINTIADSDSTLSKDLFCIRKCHYSIHLLRKTISEQLVNFQIHTCYKWKANELCIIRIGRNLSHSFDAQFP